MDKQQAIVLNIIPDKIYQVTFKQYHRLKQLLAGHVFHRIIKTETDTIFEVRLPSQNFDTQMYFKQIIKEESI